MVQRTEVQGLNQLGSPASRSAQVISRAIEQPIVDTSSNNRVQGILSGLADLTSAASEASYRQAQVDVENKKIEGMSKAVSGGRLGEEATKAEEMGFDLVESQSQLGKINEELANTIASNPNMSDEEFTALKNQKYGELLAQYQDKSPEVFKGISVKAQESQGALYGIQQQARKKYQKEKGVETLNYNIGNTLDSATTISQGVDLIHQFMGQGEALGLSEFETKDAIFNQMKLSASQGDNRLLQFVKGTDWGRYTVEAKQAQGAYDSFEKQRKAEIKAAQREYEEALQKQNVFSYGAGLAEIETMAKAGAPAEELTAKMKALQKSGLKFSPSTVASYLTMGNKMSQAQIDLNNNVKIWQDNRGSFNLATNPNIATEDKNKLLDFAEGAIDQQAQNIPEDERADWTIDQKIRLSQQEGMPVKTIGTALTSLTKVDPQSPPNSQTQLWMKMLMTTPEQTIMMNVPDTDTQKMLFSMRDDLLNSQGTDYDKTFSSIMTKAQARRDNQTPLSADQNRKSLNLAKSTVGELKDPTQSSWHMMTSASLPTVTQDYITNKVNQSIRDLYPVTQSLEGAKTLALKEFKDNNIILTGGIVGNAGVKKIAMNAPGLAKEGDDSEALQKRAVSALDLQVNDIIKQQSKDDGIDYTRDQVSLNFSARGDTYQVIVGGLSVGIYRTGELPSIYNDKYFKEWEKEQDKQQVASDSSHRLRNTKEMSRSELPYPLY